MQIGLQNKATTPLCKTNRRYLLTCKVSRYCLLALHGRTEEAMPLDYLLTCGRNLLIKYAIWRGEVGVKLIICRDCGGHFWWGHHCWFWHMADSAAEAPATCPLPNLDVFRKTSSGLPGLGRGQKAARSPLIAAPAARIDRRDTVPRWRSVRPGRGFWARTHTVAVHGPRTAPRAARGDSPRVRALWKTAPNNHGLRSIISPRCLFARARGEPRFSQFRPGSFQIS